MMGESFYADKTELGVEDVVSLMNETTGEELNSSVISGGTSK